MKAGISGIGEIGEIGAGSPHRPARTPADNPSSGPTHAEVFKGYADVLANRMGSVKGNRINRWIAARLQQRARMTKLPIPAVTVIGV